VTERFHATDRAVRRYRRLLSLLPDRYLREAVDELCQVFADEYADARRQGRRSVAALWLRAVADTLLSAPGAWWTCLRESGREGMMGWWRDLRDGFKGLLRRPGFLLAVTLTLGIGIGATTTILSVVDGVMLRPLPYEGASRLVAVGAADAAGATTGIEGPIELERLSVQGYEVLRERSNFFEGLAAVQPMSTLLADEGDGPDEVPSARVTEEFFELLGVAPALGRTFLPEEHRADVDGAVLITFGAWQRRYGGDPDVVGRQASRFYQPTIIVGVLPRDFRPPEAFFAAEDSPEFWLPLQPDHNRYRNPRPTVWAIGRLRGDTPLDQAREEAAHVASELSVSLPEATAGADGSVSNIGINTLHAQTVGSTGGALAVFLGSAVLLLLLASMNAATLFLARLLDRSSELLVRSALGAGGGRIARLLAGEACAVALLAGALGIGLAYGGVALFLHYAPSSLPNLASVTVDGRVLLASALLSLGAGTLAGLLPAWRLLRPSRPGSLADSPRVTSGTTARLGQVLVGGQVAVAVTLLAGASLLFSSFSRLRSAEPGFEPAGLVTFGVGLEGALRSASPGTITGIGQAWDLALDEIGAVAGVQAVSGATSLPFQAPTWAPRLLLDGDAPGTWREGIAGYAVTPEYFTTLGIARLSGRWFNRSDRDDTEGVAIVNQTFVRTQLGGLDPIDLVLRRSDSFGETPVRIVGVVEDVVQARIEDGPRPAIYVPYTQFPSALQAIVRASLPPEAIAAELRRAVARFNPIEPVRDMLAMEDRMGAARATPRFQSALISAFALVAVLLAAAGLYSSLSHWVGRRRRELGLRMALGADRGEVRRMVLGQGLGIALAGLIIGVAGALASGRALSGLLYGVSPYDPVLLLVAGAVLLLVAALASFAPARRATAVDPATVLNSQ
jgi:putative ABC transport system permease protein